MSQSNVKKEFLDKQVAVFSEGGESGQLLNRHRKVLELVLNNSSKEDSILDIGCFDGKILKELEKAGYKNLYGVDFSEVSKINFKGTSINFAPYDIEAEDIPFKKQFDIIIYSDVLEHLFSPQTTLFDIRNKLTKQGKIVFSVPNAGWFVNGLLLTFLPSKLFMSTAFGPWGHTHQFTFYEIGEIAKNLKFKIVRLSGGKMDNYVFKHGLKKILFGSFLLMLYPLVNLFPQVFSAHIFGVLENTPAKLNPKTRFELGN